MTPLHGISALLLLLPLASCAPPDRGIARLQLLEELRLADSLDEVRDHWWLYSLKPLRLDPTAGRRGNLTYRAVSRDTSVTTFLLHFDLKSKRLVETEWRYRPSLAEEKRKELLGRWTARLGKPEVDRHWGGGTSWIWRDFRGEIEIFAAEGICQMHHRLRRMPKARTLPELR